MINKSDLKKRDLDRSYRRASNTNLDQLRSAMVYFTMTIFVFFSGLSISAFSSSDWIQFSRIQVLFDFVAFIMFQLMILSLFSTISFFNLVKKMYKAFELFVTWLSISLMIFGLLDPFYFSILKPYYSMIYAFLSLSLVLSLGIWFYKHRQIKKGDDVLVKENKT